MQQGATNMTYSQIIMRFTFRSLSVVLAILGSMAGPVNAESPSFTAVVVKPNSEKFQSWYEVFRDGGQLNAMAKGLSQGIKLPTYLFLVAQECGAVNAFYMPDKKAIVICYEILDTIEKKMEVKTTHDIFVGTQSPEIMGKLWTGAFTFILMHEVGHALVHVLDLPVLGREEDAADQIAAYFLLAMTPPFEAGKQSAFLLGALWFHEPEALFYTKNSFSDEHSLNPQRQANLACWAYGKDPSRFQHVIKFMTKARAARCGQEYAQLKASVHKLLGKNVQLPD
jgi:hypothetical protein